MSTPYVGEIRMVGFNFAPAGWAFCDGSLMAISQNATLFNLIGTTYGGDGVNTFALPNLLGRVAVHQGTSNQGTFIIGQLAGTETVTLTTSQIPAHSHTPQLAASDTTSPVGALFASSSRTTVLPYNPASSGLVAMNSGLIEGAGGSQSHSNLQTFLVINFIISLFGVYPSQG